VAFSLSGLTKQDGVLLTSDFAASLNATIRIP
jgi:hypothetical protein